MGENSSKVDPTPLLWMVKIEIKLMTVLLPIQCHLVVPSFTSFVPCPKKKKKPFWFSSIAIYIPPNLWISFFFTDPKACQRESNPYLVFLVWKLSPYLCFFPQLFNASRFYSKGKERSLSVGDRWQRSFSTFYFWWICYFSLSIFPKSMLSSLELTGHWCQLVWNFYLCPHSLNLSLIWESLVIFVKYWVIGLLGFLGMEETQDSIHGEPHRSTSLQHSERWVIGFFIE